MNLSFDWPNISPALWAWVPEHNPADPDNQENVRGWYTTLTGEHQDTIRIIRTDQGLQAAKLPGGFPPHKLSQSFPTLQGDKIAWSVNNWRPSGRIDTVTIGKTGATPGTSVAMIGSGEQTYPDTPQTHEVTHAGLATSTLTIHAVQHTLAVDIYWVKLNLQCNITITATAGSFTERSDPRHVNAGDTVRFTYGVENTTEATAATGAASLTNVDVAHDLADTEIICPEAKTKLLKPTVSGSTDHQMSCTSTYELTQPDIDRGTVTVVATVDADDAVRAADEADPTKPLDHRVRDLASVTTPMIEANPLFTVEDKKTSVNDAVAAPSGQVGVDDEITYSFKVANTGNVTLDTVSVNDPVAGTVACPGTPLAPEASATCTVTVPVTQALINAGSWSTNATITASPRRGRLEPLPHAAETALTQVRSVGIVKTAILDMTKAGPADRVDAGDTVSYSFAVTNEGNVTLTEVSVADPKAGKVTCPQTTVAPGKKTTCTAVYTATSADIGAGVIKNTATVTAKAQDGKTVTATDSESFDPDTGQVTVDRIAGKERYSTAALISQETFDPGVKTAYIATGVNFPDALAGSAASGGDGPILLVTKDAIPGATLTELKRLKPQKIIVLGGTGVVSQSVESALKKEGATTRQSGSDRYSTAAAISAKHFDSGAAVAFVATGEDFPDALTGGPAAAALGGPILLTQKTKLPSATVSELRRLKPKRIVVLGGTGVVSDAVQNALRSYTAGEVSRLAGADRYSTGGAISKDAFKPGVPVAYIATGLNFPDALAGGAAGAFKDGPVLLVAGGTIPKATAAELTRLKPRSIIVLGGEAVVPKTVETALGAYLPKTP